MSFRTLDAGKIVETAGRLRERIVERFPESGLGKVAGEVVELAGATVSRIEEIHRPNTWLRMATIGLIGLMISLPTWLIWLKLEGPRLDEDVVRRMEPQELAQGVEAIIATVVFIGAAVAYLWNRGLVSRRKRVLKALYELRSLAHVVDMHQLTKDPERYVGSGNDTASSPVRRLSLFEIGRYLDYCSELLAILSKIGALYVQGFQDEVASAGVDEVENLTTALAGKIWQKIMMIDRDSSFES